MRILVDILHPAHVHVFRNLIAEARARGSEVLITARDKDVTVELLEEYGLGHSVISTQATGPMGLTREWAGRTIHLGRVARTFRPDVMIGIMGVSIAPVGRLLRIPSIVFYDTEVATTTNRVVYPLATEVVTPDCYAAPVRGNHITYPSYHELAYLHPDRFTPDPELVKQLGIDISTPFSVIRFVSGQSSHDRAELALIDEQKRLLVSRLVDRGSVLISSETALPDDLAPYRYDGPARSIHHLLAFADVVVGNSATMASEAAVLGTPAVYIAVTGRGYVDDLERRYGLVRHFDPTDFDAAIDATIGFMDDDAQVSAADARKALLRDKVDLTTWMLQHFESYRRP